MNINIPSDVIVLSDQVNCDEFQKIIFSKKVKIIRTFLTYELTSSFDSLVKDLRECLQNNYINGIIILSKEQKISEELEALHRRIALPTIIITGLIKNNIENVSILEIIPYPTKPLQSFLKRLVDILSALMGMLLMMLVAVIILPIVKKQSRGPLFFKQKRIGKHGKIFEMYKFRSMYLDAEERKKELLQHNTLNTDLMFKMDNDPRIFPFGQKLRDWSLDELPQFINVLKGDMSLIGTRPPTVDEYQRYELHHFRRLSMKPGITGMWQVSGRSDIDDFEKVVALDEFYIKNWSMLLDIKLIYKTFSVVFSKKGAK